MIDTINLKIYDLKLHRPILRILDTHKRSVVRRMVKVNDTLEATYENNLKYLNMIQYVDTGRIKHLSSWEKLPSYTYNINFYVDVDNDHIKLNFSLPKYYYGNNVQMFMPTIKDRNFLRTEDIEAHFLDSYKYIRRGIKLFFLETFMDARVYTNFVEITRIDLCFNKVFTTSYQADEYFDAVSKIEKLSYSRDAKLMDYGSTIMVQRDDWSFKVYKKGKEFSKHDAKELRILNQESGKEIFNIAVLREQANKTIRYELTLRKRRISDFIVQSILPHHPTNKRILLWGMKSARQLNKYGYLIIRNKKYRKAQVSSEKQNVIKYAKAYLNRKFNLFLDMNNQYMNNNEYMKAMKYGLPDESFNPDYPFNMLVWRACVKEFMKLYNEYNVGKLTNAKKWMEGQFNIYRDLPAKEKNRAIKEAITLKTGKPVKNISFEKMVVMLNLVEKFGGWDKVLKQGQISRSVVFRYRKVFEDLGYGKNMVKFDTKIENNSMRNYNMFIVLCFRYLERVNGRVKKIFR